MNNLEQTIQRYLLGEMTEVEREALEQEYFNDRHLFDQMVQVENELVDRYARGLLPPTMRDHFEKHYLAHPKRRERVKFAEALASKLDTTVVAATSHRRVMVGPIADLDEGSKIGVVVLSSCPVGGSRGLVLD